MIETELMDVGDWRRAELADLKTAIPPEADKHFRVITRGAFVLCYSHWEGYFNDLTHRVFIKIISNPENVNDFRLPLLTTLTRGALDRLLNRSMSDDSIVEYLAALENCLHRPDPSPKPLLARSNLDWYRLEKIFFAYGFSWPPLNKKRIFIQHQLCRIRHEIAHGDDPRMNRELILGHVDQTRELLDELPEFFAFVCDHFCMKGSD
jgi:hypothetical protein